MKIVTEIEIEVVNDFYCSWNCEYLIESKYDCGYDMCKLDSKYLSGRINPYLDEYMWLRSKKCLNAKVSNKQ